MTIFAACTQLAQTGPTGTSNYLALAVLLLAVGVALVVIRRSRRFAVLVLIIITAFGTLSFAPTATDSAVAAQCSGGSGGGNSGGDGGGSEHNPPADGDGVCQWGINPEMPFLAYSGDPDLWIKFDYTSIVSEIQPTDCTVELHYYEDFGGDTDHDPDVPSSWTLNADIAGLIGDPTYNPTPGILMWVPGSTTNFILTVIRDTATNEIVASYPSNVFDAIPPL